MEQQNKFTLPLAIVVAGALVAAAIYFGTGDAPTRPGAVNEPTATGAEVSDVTNEDRILGDRNAEIVIVEYSDIECPFCKIFHNTMHEIVNEYEGKVAWVYRHFPIAQLHANAIREAEATECAAELGGNDAFWTYIDALFAATNSNDSLDLARLPVIAGQIGLNQAEFSACLESGRHSEKIRESIEEAVQSGARGTPYSVIIPRNGDRVVINGAEPIESVRAKIDAILTR
jgi:protein-disulfide isomerase